MTTRYAPEPPPSRLMLALLTAPASLVPIGLIAALLQATHPWVGWQGLAPWLVLSPLVAYPVTLVVGFPLWYALRRRLRRPVLQSAMAGAACGMACYLVTVLGSEPRDSIPPVEPLRFLLPTLLLGGLGLWFGLVFGVLAYGRYPRSPHG